jgi:hypothetical protein
MLNATYLEDLAAEMGERYSRKPLHRLIQHNRIVERFKAAGFEFVFIGGGYVATETHRLADDCRCDRPLIGDFESTVLTRSPFRLLRTGGLDHKPYRKHILKMLADLETIGMSRRPRVVLAHVMTPHPPFIFGPSGQSRYPSRTFAITDGSGFPGTDEEYARGYREQTEYLMSRLLTIVDHLMSVIRRPAVIIVHGDHGPRMRFDWADAKRTDPSESVPVFLAIRWSPGAMTTPKRVISLVNVYREYFRRYIDPATVCLEDRAFVSSFAQPYRFMEVPLGRLNVNRPGVTDIDLRPTR